LRKLPRASRRSRGSRDQAPRSASLSCYFVWFVVNPADASSLADFLLNTEH
jgi:hypothetical protein